jgi:peptidoglycan/xylan/chitin deacetylase (PgdA/CDA1 family)
MGPPALSIVVATGTLAGDREACLAALAAQRLPHEQFEIINSPIASDDLGAAWNAGAARALGRTIVFVRDDIVPSSTFAAEHLHLSRERPRDLSVGPTQFDPTATDLSRYYTEHLGAESVLAGCCGSTLGVTHDLFRDSGGFAVGLEWGTEAELAFRLSPDGAGLARLVTPAGIRRVPRSYRGVAALLEQEGRASGELYRREPRLLPFLKLGDFSSAGEGALALRRLLLALGGPLAPLGLVGAVGAAFGGAARREAWYRFLCSYLYWRGVRRAVGSRDTWRRLARGPVILMYHAVGAAGEEPGCYIVPLRRFARQMRWLKSAGYHVLGVDELLRYRREHRLPPPRAVAITFDDGYRDNWTLATPVLRRLGFTATCFLVTKRLGEVNSWDRSGELAGRPLLSRDEIRRMLEAGMKVGAHTRTHPVLPDLPPAAACEEVEGARHDIEQEFGVAADVFAYPYGRLDAAVRQAVEQAGYAGACCSRSGVNDPAIAPFLLRRVEVRGTDSLLQFARAVRRGRARRRSGR